MPWASGDLFSDLELRLLESGEETEVSAKQLERLLAPGGPSLQIHAAPGMDVRTPIVRMLAREGFSPNVIAKKETHRHWRDLCDAAAREGDGQSVVHPITATQAAKAVALLGDLVIVDNFAYSPPTKTARDAARLVNSAARTIVIDHSIGSLVGTSSEIFRAPYKVSRGLV